MVSLCCTDDRVQGRPPEIKRRLLPLANLAATMSKFGDFAGKMGENTLIGYGSFGCIFFSVETPVVLDENIVRFFLWMASW